VAYAPWDLNTAYAATSGVYRTGNGGASWYPSGVSGTWVRALDTRGAPGYDVFAGTHNRGVYMAPQQTNWWFDLNEGLGEHRIRSIFALDYDTLFAGTNGLGAWEYTIVNRPRPEIYLPLILRNHSTSYEEVILYEDFEGTFPGAWYVFDQNSNDGEYYGAKRNCQHYEGNYSGWAAGAGDTTLSCGASYRNNMDSWVAYGPFSLADASDAELTFKLWLNSESGYDWLYVMASTDGTSFDGYRVSGSSGGWTDLDLDLSSYAGQPNVWIALVFLSDDTVILPEGAHVDNIEVRKWVGTRSASETDAPASLPDTMHDEPSTWSIP
jgi:hypothetical protein